MEEKGNYVPDEKPTEEKKLKVADKCLLGKVCTGSHDQKILWGMLLTVTMSFFLYSTGELVYDYLAYEVNVEVRKVSDSTLKLPSVTLCNTSRLYNAIDEPLNATDDVRTAFTDGFYNFSRHFPLFCSACVQKTCNFSHFYATGRHDPCITLNNSAGFTQSLQGGKYGYHLVVYTASADTISINIHDPSEVHTSYFNVINLTPGGTTSIGLERIETSRLPHPFPSNCSQGPGSSNNLPGRYTYQSCQESCISYLLYTRCNGTMHLRNKRSFPPRVIREELASMEDHDEFTDCYFEIFNNHHKYCNCPQPCKETEYKPSMSYEEWKGESGKEIIGLIRHHHNKAFGSDITPQEINKRFYMLHIYYTSMNSLQVTESQRLTVFQALSSFGGTLGLALGASIISIAELLGVFFSYLRKKRQTGDQKQ